MALIFLNENYEKLYNCSFYDYQTKPYELRSNAFRGWLFLITFVFVWILYIPCTIVMCDKELLKNSCYKLMLFLAILDLNMSIYNGAWTGITSVTGNVFCHWPMLAYWIGNGSGMAWKMQSTSTVLLAFNRCIEAFDEHLANLIFKGKRTLLWMLLPISWGVYDFIVGPPGFFNPIISAINYNPHAGYFTDEAKMYGSLSIYYNNIFCSISIISVYGLFWFLIWLKLKKSNSSTKIRHTKVFGQILLIAAFLFIVSTGHLVIQNLKTVPFIVSQLLQYLYLLFNGLPAVIYLTFNVTIKNKVRRMFFGGAPKSTRVITIATRSASGTTTK